jgi:hypothetical protein
VTEAGESPDTSQGIFQAHLHQLQRIFSFPWFLAATMTFLLAVNTWIPETVAKSPSSVMT